MISFSKLVAVLGILSRPILSGIVIPRDHCTWLEGNYSVELKCIGNQVVVGACGSGENGDCANGIYTKLLCCSFPFYYYSKCEKFGSYHGRPNSCLDHGELMLEGTCGSGKNLDCGGFSVENSCCEGYMLTGGMVGPRREQCTWLYANHGHDIKCGRDDEVVAGRCGSGENKDCPEDSSHGILCCEFVII